MLTDDLVGRRFDAFTVEERIGKGGMASVYRAHQSSINRAVALKVVALDSSVGQQDEFRQRFAQEAQMIAALEHIHILPIYEYGIVNNEVAYIAMRLLRGGSLAELLAVGPLDVEHTADIFSQIARGLHYAHEKGVIHRDLKPSNILFDESGNAYLTDFGLAKMITSSLMLTEDGNIVGTPAYMSPEQLRGDAVDRRSDVYGLGCILYHMLIGHPPFEASESNVVSVLYQHLEKEPPRPSELNPNVTADVEAVVLRALHKRPEARFATAEAMANALNAALGRPLHSGSYPLMRIEQPRPVRRRMSRRVFAAMGGLLALVIVLFALVARTLPPAPPIATIVVGEQAAMEASEPTDAEISQAQTRLADGGFIAYVTCNQTSQYHAAMAREMTELGMVHGIRVEVYDSDSRKDLQISQIERARADGATGLIVCPLDLDALVDTMNAVEQAHIPLVTTIGDAPTYGGVLVSGDERLIGLEAGRAAGRIVLEEMGGQARVVVLEFPDLQPLVTRADAMIEGLHEFAPDAEIVGRYLGATAENGRNSIQRLINEGVAFDVVLSINDAGAYGAIDALADANYAPHSVIISSVDAESIARQYIRDGYFMRASVDVGRRDFAETAIHAMVKLLAGATMPEVYLVPPGRVVEAENVLSS
jgi:ABC-type sugar transport system substrate-binding protein/predicted Ser/Thr protein kinase